MAEPTGESDLGTGGVGRIVGVYAVFASLWILLSDRLVGMLVEDREALLEIGTAKGWFFVAVTSLLLYGLISRLIRQIGTAYRRELAARVDRERALRMLDTVAESTDDAIYAKDTEGRYLLFNPAASRAVGKPVEEVLGRDDRAIFPLAQAEMLMRFNREIMATGKARTAEEELDTPGGRRIFLATKGPLRDAGGKIVGTFGISRDITDRKRAEAEMRIAATAFESQQAMMITDDKSIILRVNRAFSEMTGYAAAEAVGRSPAFLKSGRHDAAFYRELWATLARDGVWQGEIWNRRKNGEIYPELMAISAVTDDAGCITHYVGAFTDISYSKRAEEIIHSLSFYDVLTKLPNRRLLAERVKQATQASLRSGHHGAVMFIDLDNFSALNDTRGYDVGDRVLVEIARRIVASIHADDTVARLGGDEFVAVVQGLSAESEQAAIQAADIAERIRGAIGASLIVEGDEYHASASLGIRLFRGEELGVEDLLRQADASMYQIKQLGRGRVHFFDIDMQSALEERVSLENWLRKALPTQLQLHYQPQVDDNGKILGAEALVRWQHPERGMISPAAFIPMAEETGLILPIGHWVLETACRQLTIWEASPRTRHLSLAVNVSARQFHQADFSTQVRETLRATGANPGRLKLEITESMLIDHGDAIIEKMSILKAEGIRFSLDDFGTGFSSLSYLRRLPLDQLKIDQSFVREAHLNANDAAIVRTVIALGNSLGLAVIAEGVETEEQRNFLAVHGCHNYQGYLFGKPAPVEDFERLLDPS